MDACSLLRALSALSLGAYEEEVYWKMKQEKKRQPFRGKYDGFTLFLVPGLTLCLASLENWFGTNLSVVCNTGGLRLGFALWGILSGIYYMRYTFYLFRLGNYREGAGRGLVFTAGGFLIAAVLIPYEPDLKPQAAILHVALAFLAPVLLAGALTLFLRFISRCSRKRFRKAWQIMWYLEGGALAVFLTAGFINSFLELYVVTGLCGYLRYLERLLRKGISPLRSW